MKMFIHVIYLMILSSVFQGTAYAEKLTDWSGYVSLTCDSNISLRVRTSHFNNTLGQYSWDIDFNNYSTQGKQVSWKLVDAGVTEAPNKSTTIAAEGHHVSNLNFVDAQPGEQIWIWLSCDNGITTEQVSYNLPSLSTSSGGTSSSTTSTTEPITPYVPDYYNDRCFLPQITVTGLADSYQLQEPIAKDTVIADVTVDIENDCFIASWSIGENFRIAGGKLYASKDLNSAVENWREKFVFVIRAGLQSMGGPVQGSGYYKKEIIFDVTHGPIPPQLSITANQSFSAKQSLVIGDNAYWLLTDHKYLTQTPVYSITGGTAQNYFSTNQTRLLVAQDLSGLAQGSHTLDVQVSSGAVVATTTLNIEILPPNTAPVIPAGQSFHLNAGHVVPGVNYYVNSEGFVREGSFKLRGIRAFDDDSIFFTLVSDSSGLFSTCSALCSSGDLDIDQARWNEIRATAPLTFNIRVAAYDGVFTTEQDVQIVIDENTTPKIDISTDKISLALDRNKHAPVQWGYDTGYTDIITVTDPDIDDTDRSWITDKTTIFSWEIVAPSDPDDPEGQCDVVISLIPLDSAVKLQANSSQIQINPCYIMLKVSDGVSESINKVHIDFGFIPYTNASEAQHIYLPIEYLEALVDPAVTDPSEPGVGFIEATDQDFDALTFGFGIYNTSPNVTIGADSGEISSTGALTASFFYDSFSVSISDGIFKLLDNSVTTHPVYPIDNISLTRTSIVWNDALKGAQIAQIDLTRTGGNITTTGDANNNVQDYIIKNDVADGAMFFMDGKYIYTYGSAGFETNKDYQFQVQLVDADGKSYESDLLTFNFLNTQIVQTILPLAPTSSTVLDANLIANFTLEIDSYDFGITGVDHVATEWYITKNGLYNDTTVPGRAPSSSNGILIRTTDNKLSNVIDIAQLDPNEQYFWGVRTINNMNMASAWSDPVTFFTGDISVQNSSTSSTTPTSSGGGGGAMSLPYLLFVFLIVFVSRLRVFSKIF